MPIPKTSSNHEQKVIIFPTNANMRMVKICSVVDLPKKSTHAPSIVSQKYGESYPADPCIDYDSFIITAGFDEAIKSMLRSGTNEFTGRIMDFRFAIYHNVSAKLKPLRRYSEYWLALGRPILAIFFTDLPDIIVQNHPTVFRAVKVEDVDWDKVKDILIAELGSVRGSLAFEYLTSEKYTGSHLVEGGDEPESPLVLLVVLEIEEAIPLTSSLFAKVEGEPKRPPSWARTIRILDGEKAMRIDDMIHAADIVLRQGLVSTLCQGSLKQ